MSGGLLEHLTPAAWPMAALVSARSLGVVLTAPAVSLSVVPIKVRVALALVLTAAVLPHAPLAAGPATVPALVVAVGSELFVGLAIGLTAALLLNGVAIAGDVMSVQTGLSIAVAYDPATDAGSGDIGRLWGLLAVTLYLVLDGPLMVVRALDDSLRMLPPGTPVAFDRTADWLVRSGAGMFVLATRLAAPVMAALFLANVALAVLSRAVQQISAFMVAFPITISLGLLTLTASLPWSSTLVVHWIQDLPAQLAGTLATFAAPGGR